MAQFPFSLVSPERELFSGDVDAVLIPGTEGLMEVRADHAPVMATLSPGMIEVRRGESAERTFVRGGFADLAPSGLTVLAERAVAEPDLQGDVLNAERKRAQAVLDDQSAAPELVLNAQRALDALSKY